MHSPPPPPRLRILHADDDECFRLLVSRVFQSDPRMSTQCHLHLVDDGSQAVEYVLGQGEYADRRMFPLPHVVVLDQRMTTMDGLEALRIIKSTNVALPVFLFSTSAQDSLVNACYGYGAAFCISKPLDFARLEPMFRLIVDFSVDVLNLPNAR